LRKIALAAIEAYSRP